MSRDGAAVALKHIMPISIGVGILAALYILSLVGLSMVQYADPRAFVRDAGLYWAVGKGMLNGLVPYIDLFENKPPGVFLLSRWSFGILGTPLIGNIIGILALASAPLAGVTGGWIAGRNGDRNMRRMLMLTGCLAGGIWSVFLVTKVGPWQTELFGSLFATLYTLLLFARPWMWRTAGLAIALTAAIGLKEPFLFSLLAAALIVARKPAELIQSFALPLVIAAVLGLAAMFLLGYLEPYISLYLPALLGFRGQPFGPLWLRGFGFAKMALNLFQVSPILPLVTAGLIFSYDASLVTESRKRLIMGMLSLLVALYLAMTAVGLAGDYQAHHFGFFTPFFVALFLCMQRAVAEYRKNTMMQKMFFIVSALLVAAVVTINWPADPRWNEAYLSAVKSDARAVDTIMDRCGIDRYLEIRGTFNEVPLFAFTKHSPLNHSVFLQIDNAIQYGQVFLDESVTRLSQAQIIVFPKAGFEPSNDIGFMMGSYIEQSFTETSPDCSLPTPALSEYGLLYRTDPEPFAIDIAVEDRR